MDKLNKQEYIIDCNQAIHDLISKIAEFGEDYNQVSISITTTMKDKSNDDLEVINVEI